MSNIGTVTASGKTIALHAFTGEVVDQQRSTVTETVHDRNSAVGSQTYTSSFNRIFLRGANGEERDLEIADPKIGLRAGNKASFLWAIPQGKERGDYVAVVNHDTGSVHTIRKPINDLAGPKFYNMLLIVAAIFGSIGIVDLLSGNLSSAIFMIGIGAGGIYWIYGRQKALVAQVKAATQGIRP